MEEDTLDHIVFRCRKIERVKDKEGKGRREWVREVGVRWDSWEALASKRWLRMECSGQVDDEGRPILKKVDLVEEFFIARSNHVIRRGCACGAGVSCIYLFVRPRSRP